MNESFGSSLETPSLCISPSCPAPFYRDITTNNDRYYFISSKAADQAIFARNAPSRSIGNEAPQNTENTWTGACSCKGSAA
ncbi:hypothetical protein FKM82_004471 [Ascaphus truei]